MTSPLGHRGFAHHSKSRSEYCHPGDQGQPKSNISTPYPKASRANSNVKCDSNCQNYYREERISHRHYPPNMMSTAREAFSPPMSREHSYDHYSLSPDRSREIGSIERDHPFNRTDSTSPIGRSVYENIQQYRQVSPLRRRNLHSSLDNILAYDDGGEGASVMQSNVANGKEEGALFNERETMNRSSHTPYYNQSAAIAHAQGSRTRDSSKSQWQRVARQDVLNQRSSVDHSHLILEESYMKTPDRPRKERLHNERPTYQNDSLEKIDVEKRTESKKLAEYLQKNIKATQQCRYGEKLKNLSPGRIAKFQNKVKESSKLLTSSMQKYSSKQQGIQKKPESVVKHGAKFNAYMDSKDLLDHFEVTESDQEGKISIEAYVQNRLNKERKEQALRRHKSKNGVRKAKNTPLEVSSASQSQIAPVPRELLKYIEHNGQEQENRQNHHSRTKICVGDDRQSLIKHPREESESAALHKPLPSEVSNTIKSHSSYLKYTSKELDNDSVRGQILGADGTMSSNSEIYREKGIHEKKPSENTQVRQQLYRNSKDSPIGTLQTDSDHSGGQYEGLKNISNKIENILNDFMGVVSQSRENLNQKSHSGSHSEKSGHESNEAVYHNHIETVLIEPLSRDLDNQVRQKASGNVERYGTSTGMPKPLQDNKRPILGSINEKSRSVQKLSKPAVGKQAYTMTPDSLEGEKPGRHPVLANFENLTSGKIKDQAGLVRSPDYYILPNANTTMQSESLKRQSKSPESLSRNNSLDQKNFVVKEDLMGNEYDGKSNFAVLTVTAPKIEQSIANSSYSIKSNSMMANDMKDNYLNTQNINSLQGVLDSNKYSTIKNNSSFVDSLNKKDHDYNYLQKSETIRKDHSSNQDSETIGLKSENVSPGNATDRTHHHTMNSSNLVRNDLEKRNSRIDPELLKPAVQNVNHSNEGTVNHVRYQSFAGDKDFVSNDYKNEESRVIEMDYDSLEQSMKPKPSTQTTTDLNQQHSQTRGDFNHNIPSNDIYIQGYYNPYIVNVSSEGDNPYLSKVEHIREVNTNGNSELITQPLLQNTLKQEEVAKNNDGDQVNGEAIHHPPTKSLSNISSSRSSENASYGDKNEFKTSKTYIPDDPIHENVYEQDSYIAEGNKLLYSVRGQNQEFLSNQERGLYGNLERNDYSTKEYLLEGYSYTPQSLQKRSVLANGTHDQQEFRQPTYGEGFLTEAPFFENNSTNMRHGGDFNTDSKHKQLRNSHDNVNSSGGHSRSHGDFLQTPASKIPPGHNQIDYKSPQDTRDEITYGDRSVEFEFSFEKSYQDNLLEKSPENLRVLHQGQENSLHHKDIKATPNFYASMDQYALTSSEIFCNKKKKEVEDANEVQAFTAHESSGSRNLERNMVNEQEYASIETPIREGGRKGSISISDLIASIKESLQELEEKEKQIVSTTNQPNQGGLDRQSKQPSASSSPGALNYENLMGQDEVKADYAEVKLRYKDDFISPIVENFMNDQVVRNEQSDTFAIQRRRNFF